MFLISNVMGPDDGGHSTMPFNDQTHLFNRLWLFLFEDPHRNKSAYHHHHHPIKMRCAFIIDIILTCNRLIILSKGVGDDLMDLGLSTAAVSDFFLHSLFPMTDCGARRPH